MARNLTNEEKRFAKAAWPKMNVERVIVSGEATPRYNCLAWTLGITSHWVWPWGGREPTKVEFDKFYRKHGFYPSSGGTVSAFGASANVMKHGSISGEGHGSRWESKCGSWLRIQHGLGEMEGGGYGKVIGFYSKNQRLTGTDIQAVREEEELMQLLPENEKELVTNVTKSYNAEGRQAFEEVYSKWEKTWDEPPYMMSSNPGDYAKSPEFWAVISLGEDIVPLLIEKLTDPSQFFALQAVAQLARREVNVTFEIDDPDVVLGGEQERAAQTVRRWLAFEA